MGFMTLIDKLPSLQDRLDFTWQKLKNGGAAVCSSGLEIADVGSSDHSTAYFGKHGEFVVHIFNDNPFDATSGIQIDFTNLKAFLDATGSGEANEQGVTIKDDRSWGRNDFTVNYRPSGYGPRNVDSSTNLYYNDYLQAYSHNSGRFLAVYNSKICSLVYGKYSLFVVIGLRSEPSAPNTDLVNSPNSPVNHSLIV